MTIPFAIPKRLPTHEDEEETKAGIEGRDLQASWIARIAHLRGREGRIRDIGAVRVEPWDECCCESKPKGACRSSQDPLLNCTQSGATNGLGLLGPDSPNVPKTTKGKVFPTIHSPIEPRIMRIPPKAKKTPG